MDNEVWAWLMFGAIVINVWQAVRHYLAAKEFEKVITKIRTDDGNR